jgi:hypothetical protein
MLGLSAPRAPDSDPSDLERTRELPPGSRIASAWPRPTPKGPGAQGSVIPRPASGGIGGANPFPGLSGLTGKASQSPKPGTAQPFQPAAPVAPPFEAPRPPGVVPLEEISSSLLLPDDSGALLPEPEELSGSVLIEDSPDGQGPIVTDLRPHAAHAGPPAEQAPRSLGMPHLPTSTPPPVLTPSQLGQGQALGHGTQPAGDAYADPGAAGDSAHADVSPGRVVELPAEQGYAQESGGYLDPAAYEETSPPGVRGLSTLIAQARAGFERLRGLLLAAAQRRPGSRGSRPQWTTATVTLAGLFVGVAVVGLIFALTGKRKGLADEEPGSASSAASALASGGAQHAAPSASVAATPATAPAPAASSPSTVIACTVTATPQMVAPAAIVPAGVEVRPFGDAIALGFAPGEHEARALRVDPVTLAAGGGVGSRSTDLIRRVRPVVTKESLGLAIDAERKHDRIQGRRTLPIDPPLQVGAYGGDLVWARSGGGPVGKLWPLSGSDDVDALRAGSEGAPGDTTTAIAFRQGGQIWFGVATGYRSLSARGDLSRIAGLGPTVGSPAVAVSEGAVVVAWSDRTSSDVPWHIRMVHMKPGEGASEPVNFTPPAGGPGGHAMSPSLAAVPGGRFLLVWTEGPTSQQRVRAVTLTASGETVGGALEISNGSVNSGQGQAAVTATAGAKGIVAFLQASGDGFEVAATGIRCDS